ncbi:hypothetical protein Enr10x_19180 [Gimesia panareensis]|uniref:Uncharacterized protein n=1 Tax=Gimesia panareensis TaxID=2527978 RepID=A0A517Q4R0_9PLAN|nr:hypothetical protein [Gimesia panareensis]QDT26614.1 hypothetical protein Enr10x_19180 [Gimesia panareensis]
MSKPHQRIGSKSNTHVGREFELATKNYFITIGLELSKDIKIAIGVDEQKKEHAFDLGCEEEKILVECKSHKWTAPNDNVPSAKLTVWNEAMYYFHVSPSNYRKIFFVLRDYSNKRKETLAEYYIRTYGHLIPFEVEIWEFDETKKTAIQLPLNKRMQSDAAKPRR